MRSMNRRSAASVTLAVRLRTSLVHGAICTVAAVIAIGLVLVATSALAFVSGVGGAGGLVHALHVAAEDGVVAFYLVQLVSVSFFHHTAGLRFMALPGLALVAVAIATSAMMAARLAKGSTRRRMLVAMLVPIPYALLSSLGARYLSLRFTGPGIGRDVAVLPASIEAFLLPLGWGLLFAPVGGLVGMYGRSWTREACRLLGVWAIPARCSLRALAVGLALTSAVAVVAGAVLVGQSGDAHLFASGGFSHIVTVLGGLLLALPTLVLALFLTSFGVSFDWRVEALSRTQGSGSIFGGTLPTVGTSTAHQVPALLALLLLLCAVTTLLVGWLTAQRTGENVRLGMSNALRAGALMTLICWLFALAARVDAQAGGYLGAHFEVNVASLLWHVPLWCFLGSLIGSAVYLATRGASSRRQLAAMLLDAARPSRPDDGWFGSWRQGLASHAALGVSFLSLPAMLMGIGSAGATPATDPAAVSLAPIRQAAEQQLRTDAVPGSRLSVTVDPSTRVINSANVEIPFAALGASPSQSPIVKAKAVLAHYGNLFGMSAQPDELGDPQVVTEPITKAQHIGMTHIYFKQMADGVPVFGGSIGIHLSHNGQRVDFVSGSFIPDVSLTEDKVAISSARAVSLAKVALPAGKLLHPPHLEVFTGALSRPSGPTARLAWYVWLTTGPLKESKEYVIDAVTGSILHVFNKSFNIKKIDIQIYSAEHNFGSGALPGKLVWEEKDPEPKEVETKKTMNDIKEVGQFYQQEEVAPHCPGTNCAGGPTIATVNYGKAYRQAEWNPEHHEIVLGEGYPEALDIVAHEFSEGITETITGEVDEGQTGALNEGWADAMGKAVEAYTNRGKGETWTEPNWQVGKHAPGGAVRNLKEPHEFSEIPGHPDPEKLSEYVTVCQDNDDMHENSTIFSHAFYLLAQKSGIKEATRVFYRMQKVYLVNSPTATLELARAGAVGAAGDLFGAGAPQVKATEEAFDAVGLNGVTEPPSPSDSECKTESECAAGRAIADRAPMNGTSSNLDMLVTLYRARGKLAQPSTAGHYFMPLYEQNMGRITELESFDPTLEEMTVDGLRQITPALNALAEGEGQKFKLSASEMAQIEADLKRLAQDDRIYSGGGSLAKLIERELKWLRLRTYAGMTYKAGFSRLNKAVASSSDPPPPTTIVVDPNCEKPYTNEFQVYGFSVSTPGHSKPGEISPIDASGVACGTSVEKVGEPFTCSGKETLNTKVALELPPGDTVHRTTEMNNGSWIGQLTGRTIGCAGDESRVVFGKTGLRSLKKWTTQCPESAIACYEASGSFETSEGSAEGHGYAWVKEESKRLVLTTGPPEVEAKNRLGTIKVPVSLGQFGVELCALAGEPSTEACGTSASAWVHKNGDESQPGCPTEDGRYVVRVTNDAEKTTLPAESCVYWGEEVHKQAIDAGNSLTAVSCVPETTECAATASKGNAMYSTNVSATASATWNKWGGSTSPGEAIACPESSLCTLAGGQVKEGGGGNMFYATSLGGSWSEAFKPTHGVLAVSCPSSSFCVDAQEGGQISYSTNPASTSWTGVTIGSGAMNGVFCLSSAFCAAVNGSGDLYVANTEAKIKEASGWQVKDIDGAIKLHGVACTSTTSCLAVDGEGHILDLTLSGSGTATATKHDIDGTNDLTAITCLTGLVCVAVDSGGHILVSTSGGETWNVQHALGTDLTSVSCASQLLCVTVDTSGNATAFTPIGVPSSYTQTISSPNSLNAVSCVAATTECVVADNNGNALYATKLSVTASGTWNTWSGPTSPSEAVACPTSSLCVLADGEAEEGGGGNMYFANSLGELWKEAFGPVYGVVAVSCASSSLCVAGQAEGYIHYTTKPASSEWFALNIGSGTMSAVDCISSSFCAVVDSNGHIHIANTAAKIKETSGWQSKDIDGSTALHGVACTSTTSCLAVDGDGHVLDLAINSSGEATVSTEDIDGTNDLTAIACTGATCATVDSTGNVFTSSNAGATWANEHSLGTDLTSVSCATSTLCLAADTTGDVTTFRGE
jgi:Zn-dependent metalloprotease